MQKTYIITFNFAINRGAQLQLYALQKYLKTQGYEVLIVDYRYSKKKMQKKSGVSIKQMIIKTIEMFNKMKFIRFQKKHFQVTSKCMDTLDIERLPQPDYYIAGSDQIWNYQLTRGFDPGYFLNFHTQAKKIFYAASAGFDNITEDVLENMMTLIDPRSIISVREKNLQTILKNKWGKEVSHVLDPTFLLNESDYNKIMRENNYRNYVLIYQMVDDERCYELARKIAEENDLTIIDLMKIRKREGVDKVKFVLDSADFLGYIKNAEFIVTNSFHGTAFSIIYKKDFYAVRRENVQSRISSLLETLGLKDRIIDEVSNISIDKVDYTKNEWIIKNKIEESKKFLNNSMME